MTRRPKSTQTRLCGLVIAVAVGLNLVGCAARDDPAAMQPTTPGTATPLSVNPWTSGDLTTVSGTPPAVRNSLAGYVVEGSQSQHVFFVSAITGNIQEIWWDLDGWHSGDVTAAADAAPANPDSLMAYASESTNTQHLMFVGRDDAHVYELRWDPDGWTSEDLTELADAPDASATINGYAIESQLSHHIFYIRKTDRHVQELWWDTSQWRSQDLSAATQTPAALEGAIVAYVDAAQSIQHVVYAGADSHLHELWCDDTGWHTTDLTAVTGAPGAVAGTAAGYMFDAQGTQHVFYVGADNKIHELWTDPSGWHASDLTTMTGAPTPAASLLGAYAFEAQGTQHVIYLGVDDKLYELWWDSDGWHVGDLSASVAAPTPARGRPLAYAFESQHTQHVVYVTADDGRIVELWSGNPQG